MKIHMERLTFRDEQGNAHTKRGSSFFGIIKKLAHYEELEEQGLLLTLPCKVGDVVWFVGNKYINDYEIRRFIVDNTGIDAVQVAKAIEGRDYWNSFSICDFGKTVFLTEQEAQAALEKMKAGGVNES